MLWVEWRDVTAVKWRSDMTRPSRTDVEGRGVRSCARSVRVPMQIMSIRATLPHGFRERVLVVLPGALKQ